MKKKISLKDIAVPSTQLVELTPEELVPLPYPYNEPQSQPKMKQMTTEQRQKINASLDGISAIGLMLPKSPEEEEAFVSKFLSGLTEAAQKGG